MKTRRWVAAGIALLGVGVAVAAAALDGRVLPGIVRGVWASGDGVFQVKPYLQLGHAPAEADSRHERCELLWTTADRGRDGSDWSVEVRAAAGGAWVAA